MMPARLIDSQNVVISLKRRVTNKTSFNTPLRKQNYKRNHVKEYLEVEKNFHYHYRPSNTLF
jgi:hypothetical protein